MKIGLVTRRAGYNFGSTLQAYALHSFLRDKGYENIIIDVKEYRLRGKFRLLAYDVAYVILKILGLFLHSIKRHKTVKRVLQFKQSRDKYDKFEKKYFNITSTKYSRKRYLQRDFKEYDYLICGSDQIWSPLTYNPFMFLNFANPLQTKTISYAPSIGVSQINEHREDIAMLINRIDYLSVREEKGKELIKDITGRDALVVLDPTLLFDQKDWISLMKDGQQKVYGDYILCYFLSSELLPIEFINNLQLQTNMKIINLQTNYCSVEIKGANNRADVGPIEFLQLIQNAKYVCTDSFHGTIFSIQFEKEFYVFNRFDDKDNINQNSRINTLLKSLNLDDRLMKKMDTVDLSMNINYVFVENILSKLREKSIKFLISSIK